MDSPFVLIVEDDKSVTRAICRALGQRVSSRVVGSGEEAIGLITDQGNSIRGVVIDFRLAGKATGSDVVSALVAARPGVPALFVTGFPDNAVQRKVLRLGIPYIEKGVAAPRALSRFGRLCAIEPEARRNLLSRYCQQVGLTPTQSRIIGLRLGGLGRRDIPQALGISSRTVDKHWEDIRGRVGCDRIEDLFIELAWHALS